MARPRKSDADRRRQQTYRFSPETLDIINQVSGVTKTAFIEEAIRHYYYHEFLASEPEPEPEPEPVPAPAPVSRPAPAPAPVPTAKKPLPTYQIYIAHEEGPCPNLPGDFDYIDLDRSTKRKCPKPTHRVFSQPTTIDSARRRAEQLQKVAGVVRVWVEDGRGKMKYDWPGESGLWQHDQ